MQPVREMEESRRVHELDSCLISITKTNSGLIVMNERVQMCINERTGLKKSCGVHCRHTEFKSLRYIDAQKKLVFRVSAEDWENKKIYLGVQCEKGVAEVMKMCEKYGVKKKTVKDRAWGRP